MSARRLLAVVVALALVPPGAAPAVGPPEPAATGVDSVGAPGTGAGPTGATAPAAATATGPASEPTVLAAYPNPVRDGDPGEFVVVRVPARGNWSLVDDGTALPLPANASGVVAATPEPELVGPLVEYPVVEVGDDLRLANAGDDVALRHDGVEVDAITYERAPEGELYRPDEGWRPLGATAFRPVEAGPATVEAFVLPDAPAVPVDVLRAADERILLAGYTLTDRRVVEALVDAAERGVEVRVLVEGGPVGGVSRREVAALDALADAGVEVRVIGGPRDRYAFHHAKYAVVDDRAVVLSENWKPAGTGGRASRGWGAVVDDEAVAAHLAEVFRADAGWRDAVQWSAFRPSATVVDADPADGSYPSRVDARTVRAESVRVLVAPDNLEREVLSLLRSADRRVLVQQVSVGGRDHPFLRATLDAARRGVEVRIMLSSAWYVREENARLVRWLNERAAAEGLPLEARLADPRSRFEKVHNKGLVVDDRVLVGSANWNNGSVRENREVALVLSGEAVAGYYARAFRADWRGGRWRLPAGVAVAVVVAAGLAAAAGRRRIAFDP